LSDNVFDRVSEALGAGVPRLAYQALMRYPDRDIFGLETLFRWELASNGERLPPAHIFSILEPEHTSQLFFWVLDQAIKEMAGLTAWTKFNGVISINMEADQLGDPDLMDHVERALVTYNIAPERLLLEVTERRAIPDFPSTHRNMKLLAKHKVMLAMDDFGEGFASLEYVRMLKPAYLKLSANMARNIPHDQFNVAVVRLAVGFARETGARLIVEGVEWAEQAKALHDIGVRDMQGYLFGMPAPVDEWVERLGGRPVPNTADA
jgi:EAL domain-containing protein (putative c-di-GMP-specific phosphodiesterase class I)